MATKYETGKLGLSDPEIEKERTEIDEPIKKKHGVPVAYFYLKTPQEIHRENVLDAMRMAISCITYGNWAHWDKYRAQFTGPMPECNVPDPKFLGTEEQRAAWSLTDEEFDAVFKAQRERLSKATIVRNLVPPEEDGGPLHGIKW